MHSLPVRLLAYAFSGAVIGALVLGLFGFFVAGADGIVNGVLLGLAFGFAFGLMIPAYIGGVYWWQNIIYRFGVRWQKRESGEDHENGN